MSEEEKEAIKKLKRSANYFVMPIHETNIILNLIDKQDKAINRLAQWVANLNSMVDKQSVIEIIYREIENE